MVGILPQIFPFSPGQANIKVISFYLTENAVFSITNTVLIAVLESTH
jgi:hypothetical protein